MQTRSKFGLRAAACCVVGAMLALPQLVQAGAELPSTGETIDIDYLLPPEDGGVRRWRVRTSEGAELRKTPAADAEITKLLGQGDVLTNFGCTPGAGQVWCEVRPFQGGPKGFVSATRLEPASGPDGTIPTGVDDSRKRARKRDFDARGDIRCAQEKGQSLGGCTAAIARSGGGDATVAVTFPNGFVRQLYFTHGTFISASATMSGVGRDTEWRMERGLHLIRVDDQRFEISDRLVFGPR
ncbi:MAG: hypothetical protein AAFR17_16465 [Pseudomonadota bacterium]